MKPINSFLPAFVREAARDEPAAFLCLCEFWPRIVGEELAHKASPLQLTHKRLVLAVVTESWRRELAEMKGILIRTINSFWATELVERISFRVHPRD